MGLLSEVKVMKINIYFKGILLVLLVAACKNDKQDRKSEEANLNGRAFPNYWEDPKVWQWNKEAARTDFIPYESFTRAKSGAHPNDQYYKSLNGFWKYKSFTNPNLVPAGIINENKLEGWTDISVPVCMELKNVGLALFKNFKLPFESNFPKTPEQNQTTILKRTIDIPLLWKDRDIHLVFEGISSAFFVYVNGQLAGYSEDSRAISEFSISKYTKVGINEICVAVLKYCDGTYFENQSIWHLHGIYRNSYLISRPKVKIQDFYAKAILENNMRDGLLNIDITSHKSINDNVNNQKITAVLFRDTSVEVERKEIIYQMDSLSKKNQIQFKIPNVTAWSNEKPYLYDLYLIHQDDKGNETEVLRYKIGFSKIEIQNNALLWNGQKIKFRGTVLNEFHPLNGYVQDKEWIETDIEQLEMQNINAVRNANYPINPHWYSVCDLGGIFLFDEANLNTTDWKGEMSDELLESMKYRVNNMWERNKNHVSIALWSLGNNIQNEKIKESLYREIKNKEYQKPISAYNSSESWGDVILMSSDQNAEIKKSSKAHLFYTMCKNSGNGLGSFDEYWNYAKSNESCAGGFVRDFYDQNFMMKLPNNSIFWAYGGLFGEKKTNSDSTECSNGIYYGNKAVKNVVNQVRNTFCPFSLQMLDLNEGKVKIQYLNQFKNSSDFKIAWSIEENNNKIQEGQFENAILNPNETKIFKIPYKKFQRKQGNSYVLKVNFNEFKKSKIGFRFLYKGESQWVLSSDFPLNKSDDSDLKFSESDSVFQIATKNCNYTISKTNGLLTSLGQPNTSFLKSELEPYFWRASTDSDLRNGFSADRIMWKNAFKSFNLNSCSVKSKSNTEVIIITKGILQLKENVGLNIEYKISLKEGISINATLDMSQVNSMPEPIRFGFKALTNPSFGKIAFFGKGPQETYCDRSSSATFGLFEFPIRDLFIQQIRPQEQGNRTDINWMTLRSFEEKKYTIRKISETPLQITVLPFDYNELDGVYARGNDINIGKYNSIIICEKLAGLGNGQFPPSSKYRLLDKQLNCRFQIYFE